METKKVQGISIKVDRPRGFVQRGRDPEGHEWTRRYSVDYGYIPDTQGGDREGLDVFLGPRPEATTAYWIVQKDREGDFDEYKMMLGFPDQESAKACYVKHVPAKFFGGVIAMSTDMVKALLGIHPEGPSEERERATEKAAQYLGFASVMEKQAGILDRTLMLALAPQRQAVMDHIGEGHREAARRMVYGYEAPQ